MVRAGQQFLASLAGSFRRSFARRAFGLLLRGRAMRWVVDVEFRNDFVAVLSTIRRSRMSPIVMNALASAFWEFEGEFSFLARLPPSLSRLAAI